MKKERINFDKFYNNKALAPVTPLIEGIENFIYGPGDVTLKAPHIVDNIDLKRYMSFVILALMPCAVASVYFYGWRAAMIIFTAYLFGGIAEVISICIRKHDLHEGFLVTGMIFPLILPPTIPLWIVAVGAVFGVIFGKEVFGGTGRNIFNPALVGRLFITIAFPVAMSAAWVEPFTSGLGGLLHLQSDVIASATPLALMKTGANVPYSMLDLLFGASPGSIGETFRIGIIIGGIFLMVTKISNWRIPVSYLGSVAVLSFIGNLLLPDLIAPPMLQLLTGGLLFGAFFMATDPVSSPYTTQGKWIYGILLGVLTLVIRSFAGYVEGVMFSIILMNAFSPLIDTIVLNKTFKKLQRD